MNSLRLTNWNVNDINRDTRSNLLDLISLKLNCKHILLPIMSAMIYTGQTYVIYEGRAKNGRSTTWLGRLWLGSPRPSGSGRGARASVERPVGIDAG